MALPFELSDEQKKFIEVAQSGQNILVDACIGSGKTSSIQMLCNILPETKRILYLTYNKLLKVDAKKKIHNKNVWVTNYHGFAYKILQDLGITAGVSDMIQTILRERPQLGEYDLLIIDEYQDIDLELSEMLELIKEANPGMQIVAVGDMEQKIYDKTTLDVQKFIAQYLGNYQQLYYTKCFRLSNDLAAKLGRVWKKQIVGVNDNCIVEHKSQAEVLDFLMGCEPGDILCLGSRIGTMVKVLNTLETVHAEVFNKKTVYASISDNDARGKVEPPADAAIFTTYDSSKGLERSICVVFDFTDNYWNHRIGKPMQKYDILRNIFCVAASRGKDRIIFVEENDPIVSEDVLGSSRNTKTRFNGSAVGISDMFEFKYKENVDECFSLLQIEEIPADNAAKIQIVSNDCLIDLSPCIGIYQESSYFTNYDIDKDIELCQLIHRDNSLEYTGNGITDERKVLILTSLEAKQKRYRTQVKTPFISEGQKEQIHQRLAERLAKGENVQSECSIGFGSDNNGKDGFMARGYADVVKGDTVYELKFVSELKHEHFLQCACYMIGLDKPKGILWNTKDNKSYSIAIPDRSAFLNAVARTITKGIYDGYHKYEDPLAGIGRNKSSIGFDKAPVINKEGILIGIERFAVIDTETNDRDEVMSIGVTIANAKTFDIQADRYYILTPEDKVGGMYSSVLYHPKAGIPITTSRAGAISEIISFLEFQAVKDIFAYNASFDLWHLPELASFNWYDIMKVAAYKQHNKAIKSTADCHSTGRLKKNFGVEAITRLLTNNTGFVENHNALLDSQDELYIMKLLGHPIEYYSFAHIDPEGKVRKHGSGGRQDTVGRMSVNPKPREQYDVKPPEVSKSGHDQDESAGVNEDEFDFSKEIIDPSLLELESQSKHNDSAQKSALKAEERDGSPISAEITATEAAELLKVSKAIVYNMIKRGEIAGYKKDNRYAISRASVEGYIEKERQRMEELSRRRAEMAAEQERITATVMAITLIAIVLFLGWLLLNLGR